MQFANMASSLELAVVIPRAIAAKLAIVARPCVDAEEVKPPYDVSFLIPCSCTFPVTIKIDGSVKLNDVPVAGPT